MRVAIAGAGAVGRSIAQALLDSGGHKVLLIERNRANYCPDLVPEADWMLGDSCELAALERAGIHTCDVVAAATGDDKVNLVFALLSKTEFAVPRVVARINNPDNQWLFTESWGVDVAVSTPGRLVAAVEEAVSVGDIVRLMALEHGLENIVEIRLPANTKVAGRPIADLALPTGATIITILRDKELIQPRPDTCLEPDDEIILIVKTSDEDAVRKMLTS